MIKLIRIIIAYMLIMVLLLLGSCGSGEDAYSISGTTWYMKNGGYTNYLLYGDDGDFIMTNGTGTFTGTYEFYTGQEALDYIGMAEDDFSVPFTLDDGLFFAEVVRWSDGGEDTSYGYIKDNRMETVIMGLEEEVNKNGYVTTYTKQE